MPYPALHSSLSTGGACVNKLACGTVLRTWSPSLDFQLPTVLGQLSRRRKGPLKQRSTEIAGTLEAQKGKGDSDSVRNPLHPVPTVNWTCFWKVLSQGSLCALS